MCKVGGCDIHIHAKGLCWKHYIRQWRHGSTEKIGKGGQVEKPSKPCCIDDCNEPVRARSFCDTHYTRWKRHGDPLYAEHIYPAPKSCAIPFCTSKQTKKFDMGFCYSHRKVIKNGIDPTKPVVCYICGREYPHWIQGRDGLHLDHVIPDKEEQLPCCSKCNRSKQDMTPQELLEWCEKVLKHHSK